MALRAIFSVVTALVVSLILGPVVIRKLREYQIGQAIRDVGPKSHLSKAGTPTMGGVLILLSIVVSTLLWGDLENRFVWVAILVIVFFGAIGHSASQSNMVSFLLPVNRGCLPRFPYRHSLSP